MLPIVPDFLNVELQGFTNWDPNDSLLGAEAYVIPIPIAKKRLIIKVRGQQFQAKVHAVDLGFAITLYKIQGHTLPLLILNPYKRGCAPEINLMSLLVGLSRVRESRNVRLLPPPAHTGLTPLAHLRDLKSDNNFRIWMAGYDEHGIWSVDRALLAVNSEQASRRTHRRTINQPSRQVRQRTESFVGTLPVVTVEIELPIQPASIPHEPILRKLTEANVASGLSRPE